METGNGNGHTGAANVADEVGEASARPEGRTKISWRGGLFLVGPDPLTSLFYASGLLVTAGVGYASPLFIIGLYALLFLLAAHLCGSRAHDVE